MRKDEKRHLQLRNRMNCNKLQSDIVELTNSLSCFIKLEEIFKEKNCLIGYKVPLAK